MAASKKKTSTTKKKSKTVAKKSSSVKKSAQRTKTAVAKTKKTTLKKKAAKVKVPKKKSPAKTSKKKNISEMTENEVAAMERGDDPMTVVDHLDEFRSRILVTLITITTLTIVAFFFAEYIITFINQPFLETGQKLNIFKLTGGFIIQLKVAFVSALLISLPLIVIQVWRFIMPAITKQDRKFSRIVITTTVLLFYGGIAFVFFVILPFAITMLLKFIPEDMLSTIGANDYFTFILISGLAMGFLFELPIVVLVLSKMGIVTPQFLIQKRKYSIVGIWIIAALITPQDPFTQAIVAIPLMILYEISIVISRIIFIRKRRQLMA